MICAPWRQLGASGRANPNSGRFNVIQGNILFIYVRGHYNRKKTLDTQYPAISTWLWSHHPLHLCRHLDRQLSIILLVLTKISSVLSTVLVSGLNQRVAGLIPILSHFQSSVARCLIAFECSVVGNTKWSQAGTLKHAFRCTFSTMVSFQIKHFMKWPRKCVIWLIYVFVFQNQSLVYVFHRILRHSQG